MERVLDRGAGLDVHKKTVAVSVRVPGAQGETTRRCARSARPRRSCWSCGIGDEFVLVALPQNVDPGALIRTSVSHLQPISVTLGGTMLLASRTEVCVSSYLKLLGC